MNTMQTNKMNNLDNLTLQDTIEKDIEVQNNKMNNLDNLTLKETVEKAIGDGKFFCENAKMTDHVTVNPTSSLSYINYDCDPPFTEFTCNNNPFGVYDVLEDGEFDKLKTVDYSFPVSTISPNMALYFDEFHSYVSQNYPFETINGETSYRDVKNKTSGTFKGIRKFFNLPENSKMANPPEIASVKIAKNKYMKKQPPTNYEFSVMSYEKEYYDDIKNIKELIQILKKGSSYKLYIKPVKLLSSYKHYGTEYRLSWQVFGMKEKSIRNNNKENIKKLLFEISDDEKSNGDEKSDLKEQMIDSDECE